MTTVPEEGQALRHLPEPWVLLQPVRDAAGVIVDFVFGAANEAAAAFNGMSHDQLVGTSLVQLHPNAVESGLLDMYRNIVETGEPMVLTDWEYAQDLLGGEKRYYDVRASRFEDGVTQMWIDVTDRHHALQALTESELRYRMLADNASDVIWQVDREGLLTWASESTADVLGWSNDELIGVQSMSYLDPDDRAQAMNLRSKARAGFEVTAELRFRRKDGSFMWMAATVKPLRAHADEGRVVVLHDIDAEVKARSALEAHLGRDSLTNLLTRASLEQVLAKEAHGLAPLGWSVLCMAIDSLSAINNAYTHAVGDVALTVTAARMATEASDARIIARGDGAVFFAVFPNDPMGARAAEAGERMRRTATESITVGPHSFRVTVSGGIALAAPDQTPSELIREATTAMRAAKSAGRDRIEFATPELAASALHLVTLTEKIGRGLQDGEFACWFQPIVDLVDQEVQGYEALTRWVKPDGTVMAPAEFMHVLERSSLISDLDEQVLAHCLDSLAVIPHAKFLSVNISARSLASPQHCEAAVERIKASGIDPARLHMEVTETELLASTSAVATSMQAFADAGVRWYVDDFGTGYSSISHLRDLPIRGLKLDVSFTQGIGAGDVRSMQIARALSGLGLGLGLDTIAEGVETQDERLALLAQGWRRGQGYLFGEARPLT